MTNKTKAVVTVAIGREFLEIARLTHPAMRQYARAVDAEFIVIDSYDGPGGVQFSKFSLYELLKVYDRILYLDTDALILPDCPDLFKLVPRDQLGVFLESELVDSSDRIRRVQKFYGEIGWTGQYFSAGVIVISAAHRMIFNPEFQKNNSQFEHDPQFEFDQGPLNWQVQKLGIPIFNIGKSFNHEVWEMDGSRFKSHIIHYVNGGPIFWISKTAKISRDLFVLNFSPLLRGPLIGLLSASDYAAAKLIKWTHPLRLAYGFTHSILTKKK